MLNRLSIVGNPCRSGPRTAETKKGSGRGTKCAFIRVPLYGLCPKGAEVLAGRHEPMTDRCRLCGLPLFEQHSAVVEVTQRGTVIRKAIFYWLHARCADDWAHSEIKRLREVYRDQSDFDFALRVEAEP